MNNFEQLPAQEYRSTGTLTADRFEHSTPPLRNENNLATTKQQQINDLRQKISMGLESKNSDVKEIVSKFIKNVANIDQQTMQKMPVFDVMYLAGKIDQVQKYSQQNKMADIEQYSKMALTNIFQDLRANSQSRLVELLHYQPVIKEVVSTGYEPDELILEIAKDLNGKTVKQEIKLCPDSPLSYTPAEFKQSVREELVGSQIVGFKNLSDTYADDVLLYRTPSGEVKEAVASAINYNSEDGTRFYLGMNYSDQFMSFDDSLFVCKHIQPLESETIKKLINS